MVGAVLVESFDDDDGVLNDDGCNNSQAWMETLSEHAILCDVKGILYSEGERYVLGLDDGRRGMPFISGK